MAFKITIIKVCAIFSIFTNSCSDHKSTGASARQIFEDPIINGLLISWSKNVAKMDCNSLKTWDELNANDEEFKRVASSSGELVRFNDGTFEDDFVTYQSNGIVYRGAAIPFPAEIESKIASVQLSTSVDVRCYGDLVVFSFSDRSGFIVSERPLVSSDVFYGSVKGGSSGLSVYDAR